MMRRAIGFVRRKGWSEPGARVAVLRAIANRIFPDYRLTWPQMGWWHDSEFNAYLDRFDERNGFNTHRRWTLWQLLRLVSAVEGDTAECGVFKGASSWLICRATDEKPRQHHLFDSFEGLSQPESADGTHWKPGDLAAGEDLVRNNLRPFADRLVFHKGWIPDRFDDVRDRTFAFVHVDVDLRQPTLDSLEFFYPRLAAGAVLLCDDYGCTTCPGATEALDDFLADKSEKMISLDAGGGFFIRGTPTAIARPAVA
jgi:O-methyltransferase